MSPPQVSGWRAPGSCRAVSQKNVDLGSRMELATASSVSFSKSLLCPCSLPCEKG